MREKGYSDAEAADQILVQQVRREAGKIKGGDVPHPKSAAALPLLALATVAATARPALQMILIFAWDAKKKLGIKGAGVHVQADPSQAELTRRKFESRVFGYEGEEETGRA